MAAITAKDVKRLRDATDAGMMACKKALVEADGDFEKAIEILRKTGAAKAAKREGREANEGAVFVQTNADKSHAVLVELNCETDFVARNGDFQTLGQQIADLAEAHQPADLNALKALDMGGNTVEQAVLETSGTIGEKLDLSKYVTAAGDAVVTYIHPGARVGVVVAFDNVNGQDVAAVGKDVAMQIAAMKPIAIDKDGIPQSIIDKEVEIGMEQARQTGKPEAILEKIARGKLGKFFKENTLLNQDFVKDTSKTVAQYVKGELGDVSIVAFQRLQLGTK
ncbi:MAG: translation elongation factor Ts [Bacteroidota bacterium]